MCHPEFKNRDVFQHIQFAESVPQITIGEPGGDESEGIVGLGEIARACPSRYGAARRCVCIRPLNLIQLQRAGSFKCLWQPFL